MTLPATTTGVPSYSLAKAEIRQEIEKELMKWQGRYGMTDLEMAELLHEMCGSWLTEVRRMRQRRSPARKGALGTPRA